MNNNLISPEYKFQNVQLHATNPNYGTSAHYWASPIGRVCKHLDIKKVLDYGCGKMLLGKYLKTCNSNVEVLSYDPAIKGYEEVPTSGEKLVAVLDVMEHIEPDKLDAVLEHIGFYSQQIVFLCIATRKAVKLLPDGRNAHLIVEDSTWWKDRIEKGMKSFDLVDSLDMDGQVLIIIERKGNTPLSQKPYEEGMYGC